MIKIKDIVELQERYKELLKTKTLTKKIARNEITLKEIDKIIEKVVEDE